MFDKQRKYMSDIMWGKHSKLLSTPPPPLR